MRSALLLTCVPFAAAGDIPVWEIGLASGSGAFALLLCAYAIYVFRSDYSEPSMLEIKVERPNGKDKADKTGELRGKTDKTDKGKTDKGKTDKADKGKTDKGKTDKADKGKTDKGKTDKGKAPQPPQRTVAPRVVSRTASAPSRGTRLARI
jgi:hypothetical protein